MEVDPLKLKIAQQSAKLFLNQMSAGGVTPEIQLMAVELLAKTLISTHVTESKRLQYLDLWIRSIRGDVIAALKTRKAKTNGK
jgi:hypothetical protein